MTAEPTGRELDAWLAEHAMGQNIKWKKWHPQLEEDAFVVDENGNDLPYAWAPGHITMGAPCPHYSTDLTAAMELAEEMREKGYDYDISTLSPRRGVALQAFRVEFYGTDSRRFVTEADTLPEAIALAAYRALKAMQDE